MVPPSPVPYDPKLRSDLPLSIGRVLGVLPTDPYSNHHIENQRKSSEPLDRDNTGGSHEEKCVSNIPYAKEAVVEHEHNSALTASPLQTQNYLQHHISPQSQVREGRPDELPVVPTSHADICHESLVLEPCNTQTSQVPGADAPKPQLPEQPTSVQTQRTESPAHAPQVPSLKALPACGLWAVGNVTAEQKAWEEDELEMRSAQYVDVLPGLLSK